jgi:hypothetical protein
MLHFLVNPFPFHKELLVGQLRDRRAHHLTLRHLSPATARHYLLYGRMLAAFFGRSPLELGEAEISQFLLHCIEVQKEKNEMIENASGFTAAIEFVTRSELNTTERDSNSATLISISTYGFRQREVCYEEGSSRGA